MTEYAVMHFMQRSTELSVFCHRDLTLAYFVLLFILADCG